ERSFHNPAYDPASIVEHKIIIFAFEPRVDGEVLADLFQNQFRHLKNQNASSARRQHRHSEDKTSRAGRSHLSTEDASAESDQHNAPCRLTLPPRWMQL